MLYWLLEKILWSYFISRYGYDVAVYLMRTFEEYVLGNTIVLTLSNIEDNIMRFLRSINYY